MQENTRAFYNEYYTYEEGRNYFFGHYEGEDEDELNMLLFKF